ncbi:FAD:protein FMN transferase [Pseudofulvibacter geojedonensis]|uniref:FAD:protein FMN transferase n=1 Tax=Pseudofulvibacter geojedonensis TaxID=1123758 RepID=A0ABW3I0V8_9FLAO
MRKVIVILLVAVVSLFFSCKQEPTIYHNTVSGQVFGTNYTVQFFDKEQIDYSKQYDSLFTAINKSMSTYQSNSDISKINSGDSTIVVDEHFKKVFQTSKQLYTQTNGFFDPTIGDIVNLWRFGPKELGKKPDSVMVDSLMKFVGFDKVTIESGLIKKEYSNTFLDFNAIAKGYALDVVAEFLDSKQLNNYLIDIGGEVVAKGSKPKNSKWKVGIDNPNFDGSQEAQRVIELTNESMATSGVYRKFKIDEEGNRYAHIFNTKTGYSSKTNVLSVSVIAPSCMLADGYATAFQAMGIDKVKTFLLKHTELKVYFIYEEKGKIKTLSLNDFPE